MRVRIIVILMPHCITSFQILHASIMSLNSSIMSLRGSICELPGSKVSIYDSKGASTVHSSLAFRFDAAPDAAFHFDAYPDPTSESCVSGSATLF
jgi:hypothetical protein